MYFLIIFNADIEEMGPKERDMESKEQRNDSSSQGMVLESYAIQLLSVHVLKEAPTWGTGKKVCYALPMIDKGLLLKHASKEQLNYCFF